MLEKTSSLSFSESSNNIILIYTNIYAYIQSTYIFNTNLFSNLIRNSLRIILKPAFVPLR